MIWVVIACIAGPVGIGGALLLWDFIATRARAKVASEVVQREMSKILDKEAREKAALQDPERPHSPQEVTDALNRLRTRGHSPE